MRFLVDQPVSWKVARDLAKAGHNAVHVRDLGMATSPDVEILNRASTEQRIIVTQDADFGTLLIASGQPVPSVILFRLRAGSPALQSTLLLANLSQLEPDLSRGAIVVISENGIRIRPLRPRS